MVVVTGDGHVRCTKVPSDRAVVGVLAGDTRLTFGTTVATNALLERRVARTLLLVTEGFEDLPWVGDMRRPDLFDADSRWPEPLLTRVVGVGGRMSAAGEEVEPLRIPQLLLDDVDSVAIALLHGPTNPAHELALAALCRAAGKHVAVGHRCVPELGYLARIETTVVDAAVTPILRESMNRDRIPAAARAIRSDGSLTAASALRAPEAVLSGPAGGVLAVAAIAEAAGFSSAVGLDMGGTSTDVCRVDVGGGATLPWREGSVRVAGVRVRRRMLEVETIAAGGGSILSHDGRRMTVGPRSAGADPGPQCYGRGGPPTLTDAALSAGLVNPDAFDPPLEAGHIALPGDAGEYLAIAREAMAQAIARLATKRGIELADHALVAYGGAAGQHAAEVADLLGISTVLLHPCASVLSAFGQRLARREEEVVEAVGAPLSEPTVSALGDRLRAMEAALPCLGSGSTIERVCEVRHTSTEHPLAVRIAADEVDSLRASAIAQRFDDLHRRRYGFGRSLPHEVVNLRVRVRAPRPPLPVMKGDLFGVGAGPVSGPKVLHSRLTSVGLPTGWTARHDGDLGVLRLERSAAPARARRGDTQRTPCGVELWGNRFQATVADAGELLARLAQSVNIRERHDFSVALFDGRGDLVANAPHIPVHLGAMGATVRDLVAREPALVSDQAYLCNDPAAGGSHLPDLTVVTPVMRDGYRFFIASRGHHVDVGGLTPGSMPPHSRSLADEGFVIRHTPLIVDGEVVLPPLVSTTSRQPQTVLADLSAQIAANAHAAAAVMKVASADVVAAWMEHLADVATEAVAEIIATIRQGGAVDEIAGMPLTLAIRVDCAGRLVVDFTGTGGPHEGNLNAPSSVVRAAVLYSLRVLVGRPIPLNDGAMRRVVLRVPAGCVLDPPAGRAVVGGNVETSQRLVDMFLRVAEHCAASQGTMNNLTIGGEGWSVYETIGGGSGGSPRGPGASGRQVHMTNTRATDPEVLEARLPLRLWRFGFRPGSGGAGQHPGGVGLVREIEALCPGVASLLATRRRAGAPGLRGGGAGLPGLDERFTDGRWRPWDGSAMRLEPGDRVRVSTPGGGGWGGVADES